MMKCVFLLLALGMAVATEVPVTNKLRVFGFSENYAPWWGLGKAWTPNPLIFPYFDNVFASSLNPYNSEILRGGLFSEKEWKTDPTLRDVLNKPIIVVMKSKSGTEEGLVAYFVEHGLSSIVEYPHTRFIHGMLKTGVEKTALVLHSTSLFNHPALKFLKDMPVMKMEIPEGIKLFGIMKITTRNLPYVLIQDKDELNSLDVEGLIRFGSLDVTEKGLVCNRC